MQLHVLQYTFQKDDTNNDHDDENVKDVAGDRGDKRKSGDSQKNLLILVEKDVI